MSPDPVAGELALSAGAVTVDEDAGTINIDVLRSGGSDGIVTVDYATADGTATDPDDYTATSGTLTFADGDISETIAIPIINDGDSEPDEDFAVMIQNATNGATLGTLTSSTVTIAANDGAGSRSWRAT